MDVGVADGQVVLHPRGVVVQRLLDLPVEDDVDGDPALGEGGQHPVDPALGVQVAGPLQEQLGGEEPVVDEHLLFGRHHAQVDLLEVVRLPRVPVDEEPHVVFLVHRAERVVAVDLLDRRRREADQQPVVHVQEDQRTGHPHLERPDVHLDHHDVVVEQGDAEVLGVEVVLAEGGVLEVVFGDVADALVGGDEPALEPGPGQLTRSRSSAPGPASSSSSGRTSWRPRSA